MSIPNSQNPKVVVKQAEKFADEISEEDLKLKNEIENLVSNININPKHSLTTLKTLIKTSTSSMTSVPKPVKFLRPFYQNLLEIYNNCKEQKLLADIISVLGMTFPDKRDALAFRFLGSLEPVGSWGHEYVRHLSSEIIQEYAYRLEQEKPTDDLLALAKEIVPFFLSHNAEADGCDLLLELEALDVLLNHIDENTYGRVALYLISCASYLPVPEDINTLVVVHKIYTKFKKYAQAMAIAIKLNNKEMIIQDYQSCEDPNLKRQLSFMLARQLFNIGELTGDIDNCLSEILNNSKLSERYLALGRELDVLEPKLPEDIYKSYLENTRSFGGSHVDSALQNLASTFTNAFLNCGFGSDKLLLQSDETNSWIYKNKEFGMLSATASLGSILMWDIDMGLTAIDKFLYSSDDFIKAGALLAVGILCSSVRNDADPAMALLSEHIGDKNANIRTSCILGLGIAYAGSGRSDVLELLLPIVSDISVHIEQASLAALALGLVFVGTCNGDITSTILQTLMERDPSSLSNTYTRFMTLGLGLLFLAKQEAAEVTLETLKAIDHPISKQAGVFVEGCAFCATGNVLKIQHMLHICSDHLEPGEDAHQGFATLAIAMISMGEEIGSQMALRTFNHLMHYGEPVVRRVVPLAIGLICASNPLVTVLDTLSKYSHDNDQDVAANSIFAMGLVGAGTNNARLAQMLRQLASYYSKNPNCLFLVRIAQGLIAMGKGTVGINPFHSDRFLMSPVAVGGLLATLISFTDAKKLILENAHFLLYHLNLAIYPRFLITLDENLDSMPVTVRVGQAVDTVGQAGKPKTITGFQTHSTPVLLAHSERAELANEEYMSLSPVLEGLVILKKNPDWIDDKK